MERILMSGRSTAKDRVAAQLVKKKTDVGQPVVLINFEWRGNLLPEGQQAALASFLGYLTKEELAAVYEAAAVAGDYTVNRTTMKRLLGLLYDYYRNHGERLTIDELRTLDMQELAEQVAQSNDAALARFLRSHETRLGEVEDAVVHISEELGEEEALIVRPGLCVTVEAPVEEDEFSGRVFARLLPRVVKQLLQELRQWGESPLLVIQGTPYAASALVDKLVRIAEGDLLIISNDIFGMEEAYHANILAQVDKCMVYNHALESSAEKWARKMGVHTVRRATVSQAPSGGGRFRPITPGLITPRQGGMTAPVDMSRSSVIVGTEERLEVRPDEIVKLKPEACYCIDQRTGEYRRFG